MPKFHRLIALALLALPSSADATDLDTTPNARPLSADWHYTYPPKAEAAGVKEGYVLVRVKVSAKGEPLAAFIVKDETPGYGFDETARECAMHQDYIPGHDRKGRAIASETKVFRMHFEPWKEEK